MRRMMVPAMLALIATGTTLSAQQPRFGVGLNLVLPVGSFNSQDGSAFDNLNNPYRFSQGYDLGLGGQFTISFPVDPKFAIRLNLSGHSVDGSNTAPGYDKINLRHTMFSVGGDLQIFTQSAYRHRGTYFIAGVSADFERFERTFGSFNDNYYDYSSDQVDTTRKSRLGGNFGIGHTFGYDAGIRFTLEATYHTTLTGRDVDTEIPGVMRSTDLLRLSFGWVF